MIEAASDVVLALEKCPKRGLSKANDAVFELCSS